MPTSLLRFAMWLGVLGFVVSLAVHVTTLLGVPLGGWTFALHGGVFVAFFPVVFGLVDLAKRTGAGLSEGRAQQAAMKVLVGSLPTWQKVFLGAVFAYAMVSFLVSFGGAFAEGGFGPGDDSDLGVLRGFSGHWMVFYLASAFLAARLVALREPEAQRTA